MSVISMKQLLEAGVHFGHQTRRWNPKMAPYIFTERNGIHIIDLQKSVVKVDEAYKAVSEIAAQGGTILFVGTKKQAQDAVKVEAERCGMYYVNERWLGGMLTNFPTIRKAIKKMGSIDKLMTDASFTSLSKRERLQISRQRAKLDKTLGSIADLTRLPAAMFVVDVMKEHIAIKEAKRLNIPVFGIVDTNSNPADVDFVIPANDDASKSIELITSIMTQAIKEGLEERKVDKVDTEENKDKKAPAKGSKRPDARRSKARKESSADADAEGSEE